MSLATKYYLARDQAIAQLGPFGTSQFCIRLRLYCFSDHSKVSLKGFHLKPRPISKPPALHAGSDIPEALYVSSIRYSSARTSLALILMLHNTKTTPRTNVSFRSMLALSARINDWSGHCYPMGPDIQNGTREL